MSTVWSTRTIAFCRLGTGACPGPRAQPGVYACTPTTYLSKDGRHDARWSSRCTAWADLGACSPQRQGAQPGVRSCSLGSYLVTRLRCQPVGPGPGLAWAQAHVAGLVHKLPHTMYKQVNPCWRSADTVALWLSTSTAMVFARTRTGRCCEQCAPTGVLHLDVTLVAMANMAAL
jgi:hypothetical protein